MWVQVCSQGPSVHFHLDTCICDIITPLSYRLHTYSQVWLTDTGRFTPRPYSISLTHASTISHQVIPRVTTVSGCLSKSCSIGMTNLAVGGGIQSSTVHNCSRPRKRVWSNIYIPKKNFSVDASLNKCTIRKELSFQPAICY